MGVNLRAAFAPIFFRQYSFAKKNTKPNSKQRKGARNTFAQKNVGEIDTSYRVNFINVLCAHFSYKILMPKNFKPKTQLCNFWRQNFVRKTLV